MLKKICNVCLIVGCVIESYIAATNNQLFNDTILGWIAIVFFLGFLPRLLSSGSRS